MSYYLAVTDSPSPQTRFPLPEFVETDSHAREYAFEYMLSRAKKFGSKVDLLSPSDDLVCRFLQEFSGGWKSYSSQN